MDHTYYPPFNQHHRQPPTSELPPYYCPPLPPPASTPEPALSYNNNNNNNNNVQEPEPEPAAVPGSPSEFIYNSSNSTNTAATASIFRPSRPSRPSRLSRFSLPSNSNPASTTTPLPLPQEMGYGPSRPVEQSFPTYLPAPAPEGSLPEPDLQNASQPEPRRNRLSEPRTRVLHNHSEPEPGPEEIYYRTGPPRYSNSSSSSSSRHKEPGYRFTLPPLSLSSSSLGDSLEGNSLEGFFPRGGKVQRAGLSRGSLSNPKVPGAYLSGDSLQELSLSEPRPDLAEPAPGFSEHRREHKRQRHRQHRQQRQRKSTMMGPGSSKSIPPPLPLPNSRPETCTTSSQGLAPAAVAVKRNQLSSSPVMESPVPIEPRMKKRPQRSPHGIAGLEQILFGNSDYWLREGVREGALPLEGAFEGEGKGKGKEPSNPSSSNNAAGMGNQMEDGIVGSGSGSVSGGCGGGMWEDRGEAFLERIPPPTATAASTSPPAPNNTDTNPTTNMTSATGPELAPPSIMPRVGLFKPVNWGSPSSRETAMGQGQGRDRDRDPDQVFDWGEVGDVYKYAHAASSQRQGSYGGGFGDYGNGVDDYGNGFTYHDVNENGDGNGDSRSRAGDDETEDENTFSDPQCSFGQYRSPKRQKTSVGGWRSSVGTGSAETEATVIKQEINASPSPRTTFGQVPVYNYQGRTNLNYHSAAINNNNLNNVGANNSTGPGYGSSSEDNNRSSRSISPLTKVPTPRRLLFPTPHPSRASNQTGTGPETTERPSLRALSRKLKRRNQEMAASLSRDQSQERRGEAYWNLASGSQDQTPAQSASAGHEEEKDQKGLWYSVREKQQQEESGSSEERRRQEWAAISVSGSSEEGEVSSFHENENNNNKDSYGNGCYDSDNENDSSGSYRCEQERSPDKNPQNPHQSSPFLAYRDPQHNQEWNARFETTSDSSVPFEGQGSSSSARYHSLESAPSLTVEQRMEQRTVELYRQAIQMVKDTCLEATKWYLRAHCVNQQARGGGGVTPGTSVPSHEAGENHKSDRKRRRKRKLRNRNGSASSSSSSPSPGPSPLSRRRKGKQPARKRKRATAHSSPSSSISRFPPRNELRATDSLLPNISQICTLLWSRSQSLRLHDTSSIELSTARNMYWLLEWAETVAFAVPPSLSSYPSSSVVSNNTSVDSDLPGWGDSSIERLAASRRWEWRRPRAASSYRKEREATTWVERYQDRMYAIAPWDTRWDECGYMWRHRSEEEGVELEMMKSENGAYWEGQHREEMEKVLKAGEAVCEALGWGEGVARIKRVKGYCGFWG